MKLAILVLAAGKGTRMESDLPKVLHTLRGKPLVGWVLDAAQILNPDRLICIVGHKAELVEETVSKTHAKVEFVDQVQMNGTGHAVSMAKSALENFDGEIIVTCGDAPLLTSATLQNLVESRRNNEAAASMLVGKLDNPASYGRVVMNENGEVEEIIEAKDASPEVLALPTVNAGTYCFRSEDLWTQLAKVGNNNKSGEFYLTDVIGLIRNSGEKVVGITINEREMTGVNTKAELAQLEAELVAEGK
jgi:bifunctional UDP-N-acetylglucosamine pyrophosphorylase/glucosamine-1-phosphate N-acetyltransferase